MSLLRSFGLLCLASVVLLSDFGVQSVSAQQDQRLFGNGRFLRRVRNNIFGEQPKKSEAEAKAKAAKKPAKGKQPTLAKPKATSPRPSNRKAPTLAKPPSRISPGTDNSFTPRLPKQTDIGRTRSGERVPAEVKRSSAVPTLGFGMLVETKKDNLVVTRLDPKGNAKEAGVRTGDVIVSGGGVEFKSLDEFNQIAEVLKDGDQLEFELKRRGKDEKLLIPFGKADEVDSEIAPAKPAAKSRQADNNQFEVNRINKKNNFSFLPTEKNVSQRRPSAPIGSGANNVGMKSVLNNSLAPAKSSVDQDAYLKQLRQQQLEIQRLREQLRRSQQPPSVGGDRGIIQPATEGPALNGPKLNGPSGL